MVHIISAMDQAIVAGTSLDQCLIYLDLPRPDIDLSEPSLKENRRKKIDAVYKYTYPMIRSVCTEF